MVRRLVLIILIISALVLGIVSCTSTPATAPDPAPTPTKTKSITEKPLHIYEDGAIHVGGDGEPIELMNIPDAANPTYAELVTFLKEDSTDGHPYIKDLDILSYVCSDFAEDVHNNAEAGGIRAAWVSIEFEGDEIGHALNAFETTDRGLVYVDCTGGNVGGVERLRELIKASSDTVPSPQPTSWDSIAYVETGREYGLIYLDVASSLSYSFYEEYKWKSQEYDRLVSDYNDDVEQYSQEIEGKVYGEGSSELAAISSFAT